jgi:hypothetical protein
MRDESIDDTPALTLANTYQKSGKMFCVIGRVFDTLKTPLSSRHVKNMSKTGDVPEFFTEH